MFYKKIEAARIAAGFSVVDMCHVLDLPDTTDYIKVSCGQRALSTYQQIMVFVAMGNRPEICKMIAG